MKKQEMNLAKLMALLVMVFSISFTSCNKDDEEDEGTVDIASKIATDTGTTYNGALTITGDTTFTDTDYNVVIKRIDNNTIEIVPSTTDATSFTTDLTMTSDGVIAAVNDKVVLSNVTSNSVSTLGYIYTPDDNTTETFGSN